MTTDNDSKALTFFGLCGFEFWTTGGGCTAFGKNVSEDGYILVTVTDDTCHPSDNDTELTVGFYDAEGCFDGQYLCVRSWDDAIIAANLLIYTHCKDKPNDTLCGAATTRGES